MKVFGKELFNFKKPPVPMYDFAQHGLLNSSGAFDLNEYITMAPVSMEAELQAAKTKKKKEEKPKISPKQLFQTKALNDNKFSINIDDDYIESQLHTAYAKLDILGKRPKKKDNLAFMGDPGSVTYGRYEIESIIERLQNRKRIKEFQKIVDEFPHTTSQLINNVVKDHSNLRCETAGQFVPDFPEDAIKSMKKYDDMCLKLCGKKANFYVIADRKDFEKVPAKRDPILLAQSPFGFFWQILGAWDDEMIYLGDL